MPGATLTPKRRVRFPSDMLAAYLADLLNPPAASADTDVLRPGFLYAMTTRFLAKGYMANGLLYQPAYAWRMGPEEAAEAYVKATLERVLRLTGRTGHSVAHLLMLALVQRGPEDFWPSTRLQRGRAEGHVPGESVAPFAPRAFRALAKALGQLPGQPEPGSAAVTIRNRDGPLWLSCNLSPAGASQPARLEVADEISIWTVIDIGVWDPQASRPRVLRELAPGPEFNAFCAVLINALRTANRPVQEVLGLGRGLCPFDWVADIPINQLRAMRKFLGALPAEGGNTLAAWEAAFARHPVPGHATVHVLWESPIGQALRRVEAPVEDVFGNDDDDANDTASFIDDSAKFDDALQMISDGADVSDAELRFLRLLHRGVAITDALDRTGLIGRVADLESGLADFATDLQARIEAANLRLPT